MSNLELFGLTIGQASTALKARELSAVELTQNYLERIAQLNPGLNAYITVSQERALDDARQADAEIAAGKLRGPLHGIPIALKDLYDTAGIRTTGGSLILADNIPQHDCTAAQKLRAAGTILLGKLNTHEFAYGVTTNNPHTGPTRNPWNREHIPAGSSGGSGAAIAAGLATATLGTDTGGSIRMPASACGVVGLKPTYGRVSKAGVIPLSYLFDHVGPITRSVADAALMLGAIAGYDPADPTTVRTGVPDYTQGLQSSLQGLKVGVPRDYFFSHLEDEVAAAVEQSLEVLRSLGAQVHELDIPGVEAGLESVVGVVLAEAQEIHSQALQTRLQDFGADLQQILSSPSPDTPTLMRALRERDKFSACVRQAMETVDVLVTPATPLVAPPIGQDIVRYGGKEESIFMAMIRCTAPFNCTGNPAMSLPCGFTSAGLPVGLQIVGRHFDEATVLRVGHAYEQATPWHKKLPAL
jgi:aspartyl-tRNA(Asn)/glutamyl-tRNA(Gln) amidotransferase subunit A